MSVALYMDQHLPAATTEGLRQRGIDVLTARDDGASEADDERLLARAMELNRVLYAHDQDFLRIADRWQQVGRPFAGIVYAHPLSLTVGKAVTDLELVARAAEPDDMRNRVQFIPL